MAGPQNHDLMRRINECGFLNILRTGAPLSRSQIAEQASLDKKTVTNVANRLMSRGFVVDSGRKEQTEGRPHELLDFNPKKLCIGLDIQPDHVTGLLSDLRGRQSGFLRLPYGAGPNRRVLATTARKVVEGLLAEARGDVLGVGVAIPAVIDPEGRIVRASNFDGLDGLSLADLKVVRGPPAWLENSSKAVALAEKWFGAARRVDDFISISLGIGIGAGIVIQRRLYGGSGFFAGEIGHSIVVEQGKRCSCGNKGCLEAYLSESNVLRELGEANATTIRSIDAAPGTWATRRVFREMGYLLGKSLAPTVNMLNPSHIYINGAIAGANPAFMDGARKGVFDHSLSECSSRTELVVSDLAEAAALGALTLPMSAIFEIADQFYV